MASLLEGSAFVTGAASGIGKHTAFAFAKHGVTKLALADINLEGLEETAASLREQWPHVDVLTLEMDVTNTTEVKTALAKVGIKFGRLDIAVNNAGITGQGGQLHTLDETDWQKVLDTNLNGVYRCQKEELAIMVDQADLGPRRGRGVIINVASMYGIIGPQLPIQRTAYSTAKHAVMGLTKADATSYSGSNIRINAICPGYIATPLIASVTSLQPTESGHPLQDWVNHNPMRRLGTSEEIADSIVFLASPMSSYVNGTGLVADGGYSAS